MAIPVTESTTEKPVILQVNDLKKYFPIQKGFFKRVVGEVKAVDGVSFFINEGETLGLVGESGCGKTTTARCILRAVDPTAGEIKFLKTSGEKVDLATMPDEEMRVLRSEIQMIFQDPYASLNPRHNILDIVGEPLFVIQQMTDREERTERVRELLQLVGLRPEYMRRFPHAFSGGQRQRIVIARALALNPRLIVADEPHISDRVAVMYVGKLAEMAPTHELYYRPLHPYTEALMEAVPVADPRVRSAMTELEGDVPSPANPPSGCYFHPRCQYAIDICSKEPPQLTELRPDHYVSCHRAHELTLEGVGELP
jgi:peptide/nickel transport system ATP-binding protein